METLQCNGTIMCKCQGQGNEAVEKRSYNNRWYVTMGHAGYNTVRNNRGGYATEKSARDVVKRYQDRSVK